LKPPNARNSTETREEEEEEEKRGKRKRGGGWRKQKETSPQPTVLHSSLCTVEGDVHDPSEIT
jgi:hypothetical protein